MAREYIQARDTNVDGSSIGRLNRQKQYITNYFEKAKEIFSDLGMEEDVKIEEQYWDYVDQLQNEDEEGGNWQLESIS